jgi:hypothetical protein
MNTFGNMVEWFQDKVMFGFALYGGGFVLTVVCLILASMMRRRSRVILSIAAWLTVTVQSWWLFMFMGLASLGHDHNPQERIRFEQMAILGIVLALVVTGCWSYLLFRKTASSQEPISVPYP